MEKAQPCRVCKSENLKWKTYAEEEWWIHCDSCGNISKPKQTRAEAGEQWNLEQLTPLPDDLDKACTSLVIAMNKLPGIETTESCCGHGRAPYLIWFTMDTKRIGANVLARCLSGRYYNYFPDEQRNDPCWRAYIADTDDTVNFILEGKPMPEDGDEYVPAEKLAANIHEHVNEDFVIIKKALSSGVTA